MSVSKGQQVRMIGLMDDPHPIEVGTLGTVVGVYGSGRMAQIDVDWENGRSLMLLPEDPFEVVR